MLGRLDVLSGIVIGVALIGFTMMIVGISRLPNSIPPDILKNGTTTLQELQLNHPAFPLALAGGVLEGLCFIGFMSGCIYVKWCQRSPQTAPLTIRIPQGPPAALAEGEFKCDSGMPTMEV